MSNEGDARWASRASTPKQAGTATGKVVMDGRFVTVERLAEGTAVRATCDASGKATRIEELSKGGAGASGGGQIPLESCARTVVAAKK